MSAALLGQLRERGFELWRKGEKLHVEGPGEFSQELLRWLQERKEALLRALDQEEVQRRGLLLWTLCVDWGWKEETAQREVGRLLLLFRGQEVPPLPELADLVRGRC